MSDRSYYRSLRRQMISIIMLVSYTPLLVLAAIGGVQFYTAYRDKVMAHLQELVLKHSQSINVFLSEKLAEIQVLEDIISPQDLQNRAGLINELLMTLQKRYGGVYVDLGLVTETGEQVAYAGPFALGRADYSEARWFREAMQREYYISDVFLGLRGLPHFIIAVKQYADGQEWILRSTIDFVAFNRLVENIRIGQTGLAFIINQQGEFQTTPRREPNEIGFLLEIAGRQEQQPARQLPGEQRKIRPLPSNISTAIQKDPSTGKKVIYYTAPLKNGDWTLVFQQDFSDAFSEYYQAFYVAVVGLVIAGAAIFLGALVLTRRMVQQIIQADRQKEMMNEQVIEAGKLASVGELAAGIAHEINNPVAIMVEEAGWIQDLMDDEIFKASEDYPEIERALQQISTQGSRCKQITHKLLSFARKIDATIKSVDINDLVEEMAALSEQRAKYVNVAIVTDFEPRLPNIQASPSELQQVFLNLINNAIDAMEKTGGELKLSTRQEGDQVLVSVADTGEGIPKQILPRIFDPFFTTKPVGKGTGLGLPICFGIVEKMGGEISVNSSVGVGTTFHVRLPIHSARSAPKKGDDQETLPEE